MLPTLAAGVWFFGLRALLLTLVSVASCDGLEWAFRAVTKSPARLRTAPPPSPGCCWPSPSPPPAPTGWRRWAAYSPL
ncbi:MAG: RnfABCDGE type electron transport complex subunit D [Flavonifractor plautii]